MTSINVEKFYNSTDDIRGLSASEIYRLLTLLGGTDHPLLMQIDFHDYLANKFSSEPEIMNISARILSQMPGNMHRVYMISIKYAESRSSSYVLNMHFRELLELSTSSALSGDNKMSIRQQQLNEIVGSCLSAQVQFWKTIIDEDTDALAKAATQLNWSISKTMDFFDQITRNTIFNKDVHDLFLMFLSELAVDPQRYVEEEHNQLLNSMETNNEILQARLSQSNLLKKRASNEKSTLKVPFPSANFPKAVKPEEVPEEVQRSDNMAKLAKIPGLYKIKKFHLPSQTFVGCSLLAMFSLILLAVIRVSIHLLESLDNNFLITSSIPTYHKSHIHFIKCAFSMLHYKLIPFFNQYNEENIDGSKYLTSANKSLAKLDKYQIYEFTHLIDMFEDLMKSQPFSLNSLLMSSEFRNLTRAVISYQNGFLKESMRIMNALQDDKESINGYLNSLIPWCYVMIVAFIIVVIYSSFAYSKMLDDFLKQCLTVKKGEAARIYHRLVNISKNKPHQNRGMLKISTYNTLIIFCAFVATIVFYYKGFSTLRSCFDNRHDVASGLLNSITAFPSMLSQAILPLYSAVSDEKYYSQLIKQFEDCIQILKILSGSVIDTNKTFIKDLQLMKIFKLVDKSVAADGIISLDRMVANNINFLLFHSAFKTGIEYVDKAISTDPEVLKNKNKICDLLDKIKGNFANSLKQMPLDTEKANRLYPQIKNNNDIQTILFSTFRNEVHNLRVRFDTEFIELLNLFDVEIATLHNGTLIESFHLCFISELFKNFDSFYRMNKELNKVSKWVYYQANYTSYLWLLIANAFFISCLVLTIFIVFRFDRFVTNITRIVSLQPNKSPFINSKGNFDFYATKPKSFTKLLIDNLPFGFTSYKNNQVLYKKPIDCKIFETKTFQKSQLPNLDFEGDSFEIQLDVTEERELTHKLNQLQEEETEFRRSLLPYNLCIRMHDINEQSFLINKCALVDISIDQQLTEQEYYHLIREIDDMAFTHPSFMYNDESRGSIFLIFAQFDANDRSKQQIRDVQQFITELSVRIKYDIRVSVMTGGPFILFLNDSDTKYFQIFGRSIVKLSKLLSLANPNEIVVDRDAMIGIFSKKQNIERKGAFDFDGEHINYSVIRQEA